jgi:hypothetical protein
MIDDLFIIYEGGQLMYSWHAKETKIDEDHMISGFLTAINTFATSQRGEGISSLTLDMTHIIFDKDEDLKVQYVITTKFQNKEILFDFLSDIKKRFTVKYSDTLNKGYSGNTAIFKNFNQDINEILYAWGLNDINTYIEQVNAGGVLKSLIYLNPTKGSVLYVHAKKYVDRDKLSFIIPLIINSGNLFIRNNLNQELNWVLLNTIKNDNLLVVSREKVCIVREYELKKDIERETSQIEFIQKNEKIIKKTNYITNVFNKIEVNPKITQLFLVDNAATILYKKKEAASINMEEYLPELVSFLTSSKKSIDELYNRKLFYTALGGSETSVIILDFGRSGLILLGSINDFSDYQTIQNLCFSFINQLK